MALMFPNIRPDIVTIPSLHVGGLTLGPFPIRWYALAYIAGILLGWRYAVSLARKAGLWGERGPPITPPQIDDMILWITVGIIVGGRIGYVLFYMLPLADQRASLAADPVEVIRVWHGGMSFHGGTIGVILAIVGFALARRIAILRLADLVAACVPIGLFFGRVANFINGELWGRVTSLPWGMVFCGAHIRTYDNGDCIAGTLPRHPSQLYEASLEGVLLFLVLRWATHRAGWLRRDGAVTGLFLIGYGVIRIALEQVRNPDAGLDHLPFGLTVGMMLSVPMILAGAWLIWRGWKQTPSPVTSPASHEPG
ncbi:MAG TPA: prolipoprotein diacylglyceryl transferase [Caulobacteraceae bacterium]|nr:prolipoprotein diacylglyceryl transferase [Caulobacteraceae bacterium]